MHASIDGAAGSGALHRLDESSLFACVADYHRATESLRTAEAAVRDGSGADAAEEHLSAAEAVIAARLAFVRCLVKAGWTPPPEAAASAALDDAIAEEPNGALGG
jgi:hypothetical protein